MTSARGLTLWVRIGAVLFAGSAVLVAVLSARLDDTCPPSAPRLAVHSSDADDNDAVARCNRIADPAKVDEECRTFWAEQRKRFFGGREGAAP
jgi:conjugative transfer region protein TrbK